MDDHVHIIACSVFKDAITYLADWIADRPFTFRYLPSNLHLYPQNLKTQLLQSIQETKVAHSCMGCLYGQCFDTIDQDLLPARVLRIPCCHCYEILLGSRRYHDIIAEEAGTFFVEKELLLDFDRLCRIPLELDDSDLRELYFKHYHRLVYIRQPLDPDLSDQIHSVVELLKLELMVKDADYTELKGFLGQLDLWRKQ